MYVIKPPFNGLFGGKKEDKNNFLTCDSGVY